MFSPTNEQSLRLAYLLIIISFILLFVFRDTISHWKEVWKANLRKGLYDKMIQLSVVGDTAITSTGFFNVLYHFLDDHFLKPSDDATFDYLLDGESDDGSVNKDKPENDDESEGENDYEDEDDDDEEEEEKENILKG